MPEAGSEGVDLKKFTDDFSKKLEEISSGLSGLNNKVDQNKEALESKIDSTVKAKKEDEDDYETKYPDYDDEETKKTESLIDKKIGKFKAEKEAQETYQRECAEYDARAFREFPVIKGNAAIQSKIQEHIKNNIKPIGKGPDGKLMYPADAVYNATSQVVAKMAMSGELDNLPPPEDLDMGSYQDPKIQGREMSDIQASICAKLGIKPDRAREIYKGFKPGVRRR